MLKPVGHVGTGLVQSCSCPKVSPVSRVCATAVLRGKRAEGFMGLRVSHSHSTQATGGAPSTALCSLLCDKLRDHHLWAQQHPGHSAGKDTATPPCPGTNSDGQPPEMRGCSCLQHGEGTPHLQAALWFPHSSLRHHPLCTSELVVWVFRVVLTALFFQNISSE